MQHADTDIPAQTSKPSQQTNSSGQQQPRALKFVTNYGAPHPKRRRIGAACLTCRKRKTACSGERPFCETCKQNRLDCAGYNAEPTANVNNQRRTAADSAPKHSIDEDTFQRASGPKKRSPSPGHQQVAKRRVDGRTIPKKPSAKPSPLTQSGPRLSSCTEQGNGEAAQDSLFTRPRNRMPYFRWLGPTAIMPGFKQMVVKVRRQDSDMPSSSTDGGAVRSPSLQTASESRIPSVFSVTPAAVESDLRTPLTLPFYDTSPMQPAELITHLASTFFTHLGCNYPFLQRQRFLRDLEEKQVEPILVDAVCALAARFSTHYLLTQSAHDGESKIGPSEYGHAFALRAKAALTETFPCPSVGATQAALLLAYNEFGEQKDSGLWMYLGIAIRLAQDLGMQKIEGLKYAGKDGPTPKMVKKEAMSGGIPRDSNSSPHQERSPQQISRSESTLIEDEKAEEQRNVEQERVDTFWAIFFLDRVVSSGTGRRSTLRDKDIELSFPTASALSGKSTNWPAPFPALIRIVHLYGLVADLLNAVKDPSDISPGLPKRLGDMENAVTNFYQSLSPRLHFDAVNFQHYMKAGEGTNFVLMHFWFHSLIILLHQPTLLKTFQGRILQLFPNSQQLSMSSAKTIADILSYSQLMDAKASLGNPFTTQPIYIAACVFLKEAAEQSASSSCQSRVASPFRNKDVNSENSRSGPIETKAGARKPSISALASIAAMNVRPSPSNTPEHRVHGPRHALLATAASAHYSLCHKALQSLETYWAGTKYILTVLEQKFDGISDPLLYTEEEGERSMEQPRPEPDFKVPGWRRKPSFGSAGADTSKPIGWTLTGTMNSPSTSVAWHYPSAAPNASTAAKTNPGGAVNANIDPRLGRPSQTNRSTEQTSTAQLKQHNRTGSSSSQRSQNAPYVMTASGVSTADAEVLLGLSSPFSQTGSSTLRSPSHPSNELPQASTAGHFSGPLRHQNNHQPAPSPLSNANTDMPRNPFFQYDPQIYADSFPNGHVPMNFFTGDMMIAPEEMDSSMLVDEPQINPWFEYFPTHDLGMPEMHVSEIGPVGGMFGPTPGGDDEGVGANGELLTNERGGEARRAS